MCNASTMFTLFTLLDDSSDRELGKNSGFVDHIGAAAGAAQASCIIAPSLQFTTCMLVSLCRT